MGILRKRPWLTQKPPLGARLDYSNPDLAGCRVCLADMGGTIVDVLGGSRGVDTSGNNTVNTSFGRAKLFGNSGYVAFKPTSSHDHTQTGEWSFLASFMFAATGASYWSVVRHNRTSSPYFNWDVESDAAGTSMSAYVRTGASTYAGTSAFSLGGPAAGSDLSVGFTASAGGLITCLLGGNPVRSAACGALYYEQSISELMVGNGLRGALHTCLAWNRVVPQGVLVRLTKYPFSVFEPESLFTVFDMGGGIITAAASITLDDATVAASGGVISPITATAAITLDDATVSASGAVLSPVTGSASIVFDDAVAAGFGGAEVPAVYGSGAEFFPEARPAVFTPKSPSVELTAEALPVSFAPVARPLTYIPIARPVVLEA